MSGIFGIIDPKSRVDVRTTAAQMASAMSHRPWFSTDHQVDSECGLALGRIGIGIFNKGLQPVWDASQPIAVVMAGEFYNLPEVLGQERVLTPEQAVLHLYKQHGPDFASQLKGAFILGVWDGERQKLVIANDRFGFYPLYYTIHHGRLVFAPEIKGVLCDQDISRQLDVTAMAQYMRFQQLLGERTFFSDVKSLPAASVMVFDYHSSSLLLRPYWSFDAIPYRPHLQFGEAVEESGRLLRQSIRSLSSDSLRVGVFLSGGLDSRAILGMVEKRPVTSLTFGIRGCRDVDYAEQVARKAGSQHHWFNLPNGEWVKENVDFHLAVTEGLHSWIHAHGITMLPWARENIDVNLTGWDGGTVMGHPILINPLSYDAVDDQALYVRMAEIFTRYHTWPSLIESEERLLYTPPVLKDVQGLALDSFRDEMECYHNFRKDVRGEFFFIRQHCARLTHNMVTLGRTHIEFRFPFFDYDLFDFVYSLPAKMRAGQNLYRAVLQKELPHLTGIPYDHDEFLPTTRPFVREIHMAAVKAKRRINQHIFPIFTTRPTLYADYENYLRNELRSWAEELLLDQRTKERGIFDPSFLRSIMDRHLSGREEWTIGKIAPVMTYEMMLRSFTL